MTPEQWATAVNERLKEMTDEERVRFLAEIQRRAMKWRSIAEAIAG